MYLPRQSGAVYVPEQGRWPRDNRAMVIANNYHATGDGAQSALYLTGIAPRTAGVGGTIGDRCFVDGIDVRLSGQVSRPFYEMNAGATIVGDSWVSGSGPQAAGVPTDIVFPPTRMPPPYEQGVATTLRFLVAVDRQPEGATLPVLGDIMETALFPGSGNYMHRIPTPDAQRRFTILHDEVIYPQPHSLIHFALNLDMHKLLGGPLPVTFRAGTSTAGYAGVATNAVVMWVMSQLGIADDPILLYEWVATTNYHS